jgi:hypothetical protein
MIERSCRQARRFGEALAASGFEVLNEVALNQCWSRSAMRRARSA